MSIALENWDQYRVKPESRVRLHSLPTDRTDLCAGKKTARKELKSRRKEIDELLAALAAEKQRSLLIPCWTRSVSFVLRCKRERRAHISRTGVALIANQSSGGGVAGI